MKLSNIEKNARFSARMPLCYTLWTAKETEVFPIVADYILHILMEGNNDVQQLLGRVNFL